MMRELLPDCLDLAHQFFLFYKLELKHCLFLGFEPAHIKTKTIVSALLVLRYSDSDWNFISFSRSTGCWLQILGLGLCAERAT